MGQTTRRRAQALATVAIAAVATACGGGGAVPSDAATAQTIGSCVCTLVDGSGSNAVAGLDAATAPTAATLLTHHGGSVMPTANVYPIFWGTSWSSYAGDEMTGIDDFYQGWNGSNYAKTTTEYAGTNGQITATSTSHAHVVDPSTASDGSRKTDVMYEVCRAISSGLVPLDTSGNGYYPVYLDAPRGSATFCSSHGAASCNGNVFQFAFFFRLDGDPLCDPHDSATGHSQGLSALANVSAHELAEAMTDPTNRAWFDASGEESGDKCAWTFNVPSVTFSNGTRWRLQGQWSNAAYSAGTGYPNSAGQPGCLDGR